MNKPGFSTMACIVLLFSAATVLVSPAQTSFKTLVNFDGTTNANPEYMTLVQGLDGNFYGTTGWPPACSVPCGTIFKITVAGTLTTLDYFPAPSGHGPDDPLFGLTLAMDGNFYGTSYGGGDSYIDMCRLVGCGTIFKVTPAGTLTLLHKLDVSGSEGINPFAGLIQAVDGDLYGEVTSNIFKITRDGSLTVLNSIEDGDGFIPQGGLVQAADGNFYGTTVEGGTNSLGAVFKITAAGTLTSLHSFDGADGASPYAGLVQGTDGNFYGTTASGGANGLGTVFKMTPEGALTTLHSFDGTGDGSNPATALLQATDGNLYGTTAGNGLALTAGSCSYLFSGACSKNECGTVFKITPAGTLTTLHSFDITDGANSLGGLMQAIQQLSGVDFGFPGRSRDRQPNGELYDFRTGVELGGSHCCISLRLRHLKSGARSLICEGLKQARAFRLRRKPKHFRSHVSQYDSCRNIAISLRSASGSCQGF